MRTSLVILCVILALVSCTQSKEEKATEFAKAEVVKILNNADSYEPVETKVDSAFTNIHIDYDACVAADELLKLASQREGLMRDLQHAKSSAAIWANPYSEFGREEHRQAKAEMDSIAQKISDNEKEIETQKGFIQKRNKELKQGEFCGWAIQHSFRCTNGLGVKQLHGIVLIADEKFENLLLRFLTDEDEAENIKQIQEVIDEVID